MAGVTRGGDGKFRRTIDSAVRDMRAAELGFAGRGKAAEAVQRAYEMIVTPGAEQAKRTDFERLDRLIEKNWAALEREHVAVSNGKVVRRFLGVERDADGIERLDADGKVIPVFETVLDDGPIAVHTVTILRLIERRARMYGYDEPLRSRVEVVTADMVEDAITRLESDLAANDPADTGAG